MFSPETSATLGSFAPQVLGKDEAWCTAAAGEGLAAVGTDGDDALHRVRAALGQQRRPVGDGVFDLEALLGGLGGVPAQTAPLEQARGGADDGPGDALQIVRLGLGQGVKDDGTVRFGLHEDSVEGDRVQVDAGAQSRCAPSAPR